MPRPIAAWERSGCAGNNDGRNSRCDRLVSWPPNGAPPSSWASCTPSAVVGQRWLPWRRRSSWNLRKPAPLHASGWVHNQRRNMTWPSEVLRRAVALDPLSGRAHSHLGLAMRVQIAWKGRGIPQSHPSEPERFPQPL